MRGRFLISFQIGRVGGGAANFRKLPQEAFQCSMWACALLNQQSLTGRPNISKITFLLQNACPSALPFVWPHCSRYRVGRISLFQKVFFQLQIQPHLIQHKNIRLDFCIWTDFGTVDYRALGLLWHSQAGGHSQLHSQV